jgi:hypothetical protein
MISGAETRLDGNTLVVRVPMRFHRRSGRKRIVAPDGSEIVPTSKAQPDGALLKALARAWRFGQRHRRRREHIEELRQQNLTAGAPRARHHRGDPGQTD